MSDVLIGFGLSCLFAGVFFIIVFTILGIVTALLQKFKALRVFGILLSTAFILAILGAIMVIAGLSA